LRQRNDEQRWLIYKEFDRKLAEVSPTRGQEIVIVNSGGSLEAEKTNRIPADISISELLEKWPAAIPIFLKHHMACPGCGMSNFETLASAAEIYHISLQQLIPEIEKAVAVQDQ
jgi:hybrid cluster-associated redox disulfide protein